MADQQQVFRPAAPDKIGDRFVAAGLLTQAQVAQIVACQHAESLRFGEAAQRLGLLSEDAIQSVLAQQFRYATAVGPAAGLDPSLVIASAPFSPEAEAVRRVRAELSIRLSGLPKLAVAIVSPSEGEGKSYLAASLAIAYSQAGQRTLLVNANLRASGQSDLFGMGHHEGLSTMLAGRSAIEPGKPAPGFPGLNVLGAGPRPPNPLEILREPALERLIATFSEEFDVFIVDTPAAGTSSDAQVIARQVGQCLLVGRQHTTRLEDLERTQSQMQTSGAQTVGIVYNTFDPRSRRPVRSGLLGRLQSWVRRI
ncbi:MAG: polysaccharide biosynthesis tyrosine autokinase [Pseudomonadota bacterium]